MYNLFICMKRFIVGIGSHIYGGHRSHGLSSANWKTRNASFIIQSQSKALTTKGTDGVNSQAEARGSRASCVCACVCVSGTGVMLLV